MPIRMKTAPAKRPMTRAHIQTRVWLSIGIFVLGFLITAIVSGLERLRAERGLAAIGDAVLSAAQDGRDAEAAFLRSAIMRVFIPGILAATMGLAITLVNLTVKRSILAPLARTQDELAHERDLLRIRSEE